MSDWKAIVRKEDNTMLMVLPEDSEMIFMAENSDTLYVVDIAILISMNRLMELKSPHRTSGEAYNRQREFYNKLCQFNNGVDVKDLFNDE